MTKPVKLNKLSEMNNKTSPPDPSNRDEETSNFMNLVAEVSTFAWNLVIPIIGGVMLGHYIDNRNNSDVTWTLSLLVLGVIIAFSNLFNLYIEQGQNKLKKNKSKSEEKEDHVEKE